MEEKLTLFDGLADKYDQWFMDNANLFESELKLVYSALKPFEGQRILSVGCGSGLFEAAMKKKYGFEVKEGVEPSMDMARIAEMRGLRVQIGDAQTMPAADEPYDVIYMSGSSSYIPDLVEAYSNVVQSLKVGGHLIIYDVPSESSFGMLYAFALAMGSYEHPVVKKLSPEVPYPIELVGGKAYFHTVRDMRDALEAVGMTNLTYSQTLCADAIYGNDQVEEVLPGYDKGSYVAIVAEKPAR